MSPKPPIPNWTNLLLIIVSFAATCVLLFLGSHAIWSWTVIYGAILAVVMVCTYSLIHEAVHGILHSNERVNTFLGRFLCLIFVSPFTFLKHCHLRHHKKNRTDEEMWDLYYEHESAAKKYGTLYGMMLGLGYFSLWLSVILFAIWPRLIHTKFFLDKKELAGFIRGSDRRDKVLKSRLESLVVISFQVSLFYFLNLDPVRWLVMYSMVGFVWSSQNYVNHAFSPRDIIQGAHNLAVPGWLKYVYLNFNLHLAHHQDPKVPWIHLPKYVKDGPPRITFLRNYIRLWKGPQITREPAPEEGEAAEM